MTHTTLLHRAKYFVAAMALTGLLAVAPAACGDTPPLATQAPAPTNTATVQSVVVETQAPQNVVVATDTSTDAGADVDLGAASGQQVNVEPTATQAVPTPEPQLAAATDDDIVAALESAYARIYREAVPSIVFIRVTTAFTGGAEGSGFVWDADGHIVTNNHVVAGASSVTVIFADGTEARATVVGTDPNSDLAVVKVDLPAGRLIPLPTGDSAALRVGQLVAAIGNPFGQEFTMTTGIVSALDRSVASGTSSFSIPGVIQTDASINPGNSGGPLLDRLGKVVGINTMILSNSGSNAGVGFAVPINTAKRVVPQLIETGSVQYSYLGISAGTLTQSVAEAMELPGDTRGVLVALVVRGGPADGVLRGATRTATVNGASVDIGGDVITAVNGMALRSMDQLLSYLQANTAPGDVIELAVLRGGEPLTLSVTLGTRPSN
ncbi:MAG: trypsin-like serine protease [SAR202 cluster bacterium]|nr:trypsin-like serine protease [SAR202 cluster bacterium]